MVENKLKLTGGVAKRPLKVVGGGVLCPPPPMPKGGGLSEKTSSAAPSVGHHNNNNPVVRVHANSRFLQFVGPSCGHHASYSFYKAIKYTKNGQTKILSLGEFFFVKIWPDSDLVAIGELQLLWEDKNTNQTLSSLRLYFLPEYTPEGRMHYHGEDELIAVSEKAVLRVSDLLDWIASPMEINWDRGLKGVCEDDCKPLPGHGDAANAQQYDKGLNAKCAPGHSDFLADVRQEKEAIGDVADIGDLAVVILSAPQYGRYRSVVKRLSGVEKHWMHNSLIVSLGGFTTKTRRTYVLYCREIFDYAELEEHPYLCNHLAPKLKGRPRKRKKLKRAGSPESESASSESSASTSASVSVSSKTSKNGLKKDLLSILSQKNTKEETEFLKKLISFMDKRNTPIERPPMLGFKQIDLHLFFDKVSQLGGYEGCMVKKAWKAIYDDLGGNPQNTSAATCTRRHYEKFLLPYEWHTRGQDDKRVAKQRRESESSEKSPSEASTGTKEQRVGGRRRQRSITANDDSEHLDMDDKANHHKEEESMDGIESGDDTDTDALKNNPLLSQVKNLMGNKTESQMKIDPDGKRLQIDDLIIIPNNLHSPPEGGSALQNLAKIASRYQNQPGQQAAASASGQQSVAISERSRRRSGDGSPAGSAKKVKLDDGRKDKPGAAAASNAASMAALAAMNPLVGMTPAQQQSFFSLLPPGLLPSWPMPGTSQGSKAATSTTNSTGTKPSAGSLSGSNSAMALAAAAAAAAAGLSQFSLPTSDAAKLGPDGIHLLQLYEKTLKAAGVPIPSTSSTGGLVKNGSPLGTAGTTKPPRDHHASGSSTSSNPGQAQSQGLSAKDKDRSKVNRLPIDAKRPPSLSGQTSVFAQTSHFYTDPNAELTKAKEAASGLAKAVHTPAQPAASDTSRGSILDLSSGCMQPQRRQPSMSLSHKASEHPQGALNLKKESALHHHQHQQLQLQQQHARSSAMLDLSVKRETSQAQSLALPPTLPTLSSSYHALGLGFPPPSTMGVKNELKASPFSAESLLAKTSGSLSRHDSRTKEYSSGSKHASSSPSSFHQSLGMTPPRASPASGLFSPAAAAQHSPSTAAGSSGDRKERSSPWHTPVSMGHGRPSSRDQQQQHASKPAIPVSPVVREDPASKNRDMSFQSALLGLSTSLGFMPVTTGAPPVSLPLPPTTYSLSAAAHQQSLAAVAASNPYLAMTAGLPKHGTPQGYPAHLMDPATSAYYAALYSQSMYGAAGLSPYTGLGAAAAAAAAAANIRPGMSPGGAAAAPPPGSLDALQASALQAMMARGAGGPGGNPFAAYHGLSGLPGYPGFPPPRKDL